MKRVASGILPVIAIDRTASQALHRQIYEGYRAAIVDGRLRPGQRIPSSRNLASELGISRFPVLNAYAQLLAEGYLESRIGAGTVVSSSLPEQLTSCPTSRLRFLASRSGTRPAIRRRFPLRSDTPWLQGWGAFGVGQVAVDQFPLRIWSSLLLRKCRTMDIKSFHYGDPMGSMVLRETLAGYLRTARSLHCDAEQVMITSGSQQALEITARVLLDSKTSAWMEEPGYNLAREAFALTGCQLVPVPVDQEGLDVGAGIRLCRQARAAFVTPSHQFPLGVTMSASRRFQLLEWAEDAASWIIEDDYDAEYRYQSLPIASLQGLDANARVIYIGTFSKVLFPSLRLGYVVIPPDLIDDFKGVRRVMDLGPPNLHQEVLADFIAEGHFARHIRRMRILYSERRRVLVDNLEKEFGSTLTLVGDAAGMHLSVRLPPQICDTEVATRAARQNLRVWPLSTSYLGKARPGFILGFGSVAVEHIPTAVRKIRKLLATT
jgi:GntR family transcriptional regulator / MocR family aminotransferase